MLLWQCPQILTGELTATYNSSSRVLEASGLMGTCTHVMHMQQKHTYTYIIKNKIDLKCKKS